MQAKLENGIWTVPVEIGGKETRFVLSTSVSMALVDPALIGSGGGPTSIKVGGLDLGKLEVKSSGFATRSGSTRGVLGSGAFQNRLIGFDFDTVQVAIWPVGAEPDDAKRWMAELPDATEPQRVRLQVFENGIPSIQGKIGDRNLWLLLSSGYASTLISGYEPKGDAFLKVRDMKTNDHLTGTASDGSHGVFGPVTLANGRPLYLAATVASSDLSEYKAPLDGVLKIEDLGSRRIVLDLEHYAMLVESNADENASLAASISKLIAVPVRVKEGRLVLASARSPQFAEALCPFTDLPVISIDGISAAESLSLLRSGGSTALKEAARLQTARSKGYMLILNGPDGLKKIEVEAS